MECKAVLQGDGNNTPEIKKYSDESEFLFRKQLTLTSLYKCTDGNTTKYLLGSRHISYYFDSMETKAHYGVKYPMNQAVNSTKASIGYENPVAYPFKPYDSDVQELKDWADAKINNL